MTGIVFLLLRVALALALYAFLGWALWLLWRDLRRSAEPGRQGDVPMLTLLPESGQETERIRFAQARVLIGRDAACALRLDDPAVSSSHARLSYHHGHWWIEDLRSRNGTFVNDERLAQAQVIVSGDQLRFGRVIFQALLTDETGPKGENSV
jgi:pSer/pThr/pTyr-binding forkhead associated (FHA) protein